jgi:hypothetical protein
VGQCKLSNRQKNLVRKIVDGLKNREKARQWWIRMAHDHGLPRWQNVQDDSLHRELQDLTALGDIDALETCGLLVNAQPGRYTLVERRMVHMVKNDFYESRGGNNREKRKGWKNRKKKEK